MKGGGKMENVNFGQYALPVILMVILSLIYKVFGEDAGNPGMISDKAKPIIAICAGMGLGIVGMFYNAVPLTFKNFVDYLLFGLMQGAGAVGLWEGFNATLRPNR